MRYLYASLAAALVAAAAVPASAKTLLVPQQFSTIQAAVNAAKPYDTVLVSGKLKSGVYSESITITTPHVTLQGVGNPIIDGSGFTPVSVPIPGSYYSNTVYPDAIDIQANNTTISGLTIQNVPGSYYGGGGAGINAGYTSADGTASYGFSNLLLSGLTLSNDYNGVVVSGSSLQMVNGAYAAASAQNFSLIGSTITGSTSYAAEITGTNSLLISGNKFVGNSGTGLSIGGGFSVPTANALVAGNVFKSNGYDGLDAYGTGLTVTANESALNGDYGILVDTIPFSFSGTGATPAGAAPTSVIFNSVHDNSGYGISAVGAVTIAGNCVANNTDYGIYLDDADNSTVTGNTVTGTTFYYYYDGDGAGIYSDNCLAAGSAAAGDSKINVSLNQVSGNAGDGIYFSATTGGTISFNSVTANKGIGVHLSSYSYDYSYYNDPVAPTTVAHNQALHNAIFDARDDTSGVASNGAYPGYVLDSNGEYYYGYGASSVNVWTKNIFGTADPVGLGK